jgi:hypothetical protein
LFEKQFIFQLGQQHTVGIKKNFLNLTSYEEDFEVSAEWHFFLMSHVESACNTLGGTIKRLVARVSWQ